MRNQAFRRQQGCDPRTLGSGNSSDSISCCVGSLVSLKLAVRSLASAGPPVTPSFALAFASASSGPWLAPIFVLSPVYFFFDGDGEMLYSNTLCSCSGLAHLRG